MPSFPGLLEAQRNATYGVQSAASAGAAVATSASANTKGSWVEIITTTPYDAAGIFVTFYADSINPRDYLLDIGIGGSGSEVVLVPNIAYSLIGSVRQTCSLFIPVAIAAGQRVSMRAQSSTGSQTLLAQIVLIGATLKSTELYQVAQSLGSNTADSGGTSIDPGASTNTKGAYSELSAATSNKIDWVCILLGGQANSDRTTARWLFDVAIGGAGSEQVILADMQFSCHSTPDAIVGWYQLPLSIPRGSRVAARAQCDINDATDRLFDISIIGVG